MNEQNCFIVKTHVVHSVINNFILSVWNSMCPKQWWVQDFPEEGAPSIKVGRQPVVLANFPEKPQK